MYRKIIYKMNRQTLFLLLLVSIISSSCVSSKKMIYLQRAGNLKDNPQKVAQNFELKIQPDDQLAISISSKDKELIEPFNNNTLIGSGNTLGGNNQSNVQSGIAYFQVDKSGCIDFPVFGKMKAAGLTRMQLSEVLTEKLISQDYIKDPMVSVKIMSFKITVIGEVKTPGVHNITGERVTLLEALGMAGDLLPSGKRENIMVLREEGDTRTTYSVDITSGRDVLESPCYYLQQNDVVYVEPNSAIRVKGSATLTTVTALASLISVLASLVSIAIAVSK